MYRQCAYIAHELQTCQLKDGDYVDIDDFEEPESGESGAQFCAEICFRKNSDWFRYVTGKCRCIIGRCKSPLTISVESVYRIRPCNLQCDYISSEEWWGQAPTSTEKVNGIIVPKPVKGLRFTSEIYAEIHMLGIEMMLSADNTLTDTTLVITPILYMAGENRTVVTGEAEMPAFID